MSKKRQRSEEDPQFEILCNTGMTTVNQEPVELNKLAPHLRDFRIEHYRYINQLLGDRTLRQEIMDQFPSKDIPSHLFPPPAGNARKAEDFYRHELSDQ